MTRKRRVGRPQKEYVAYLYKGTVSLIYHRTLLAIIKKFNDRLINAYDIDELVHETYRHISMRTIRHKRRFYTRFLLKSGLMKKSKQKYYIQDCSTFEASDFDEIFVETEEEIVKGE